MAARGGEKGVTSEACDPDKAWKNHGEYVSCVAKFKLGGVVVSEAAKSDIGKKDASASPSASPTASPSASPSASPAGAALVESTKIEIKALIEVLQNIIKSLQNLI